MSLDGPLGGVGGCWHACGVSERLSGRAHDGERAVQRALDELRAKLVALEGGQVGEVVWLWTDGSPEGLLVCDGASYASVDYPGLWAVVPAVAKTGLDFVVPDLADRFVAGAGLVAVGATGGVDAVTLSAAESGTALHGHGMTQPSTTVRAFQLSNTSTGGSSDRLTTLVGSGGVSQAYAGTGGAVTDHAGAAAAASHENRPPFVALKAFIRY